MNFFMVTIMALGRNHVVYTSIRTKHDAMLLVDSRDPYDRSSSEGDRSHSFSRSYEANLPTSLSHGHSCLEAIHLGVLLRSGTMCVEGPPLGFHG